MTSMIGPVAKSTNLIVREVYIFEVEMVHDIRSVTGSPSGGHYANRVTTVYLRLVGFHQRFCWSARLDSSRRQSMGNIFDWSAAGVCGSVKTGAAVCAAVQTSI
jgi:hypothetical protein